jgi:hypothetical protein
MYFYRSVGAIRFVFHFSVGPDLLISPLKPLARFAYAPPCRPPAARYWSHSATTRWIDLIARRWRRRVGREAFDSSATLVVGHIKYIIYVYYIPWNFRRAIHCVSVHIIAHVYYIHSHFSDARRSYLSNRFVQTPHATIKIYHHIILYHCCHSCCDYVNNIMPNK